jgi:DNA-binding MarR family transcriptional regulator
MAFKINLEERPDYVPTQPYRRIPDSPDRLPAVSIETRKKAPAEWLHVALEDVRETIVVPAVDQEENFTELDSVIVPELELEPEPEPLSVPIPIPIPEPEPEPEPASKPSTKRVYRPVPPPIPIGTRGTLHHILRSVVETLEISGSVDDEIRASEAVLQVVATAEKPVLAAKIAEEIGIDKDWVVSILRRLKLWGMIARTSNSKRSAKWYLVSMIGEYRMRTVTAINKNEDEQ